MSNNLTGFFDVVVEVRVGAVNRVLATLHQKGAVKEASPKFLHSFTARVGDTPKHPQFELAEDFLLEALGYKSEDMVNLSGAVLGEIQQQVVGLQTSLRKIAQETATDDADLQVVDQLPWLTTVRGTAKVQVSTLTISLPEGSTSELTVHSDIRALYRPDPETMTFPEPIHGELQATFVVMYVPGSGGGSATLEVGISEDKKKVVFVPDPATNVTQAEAKLISRQIWRFARTKFEEMSVELPHAFPFRHFKGLGTGPNQVIALPLLITGQIPALSKPMDSIAQLFLQPADDFGVAISREFVSSILANSLQTLEAFKKKFSLAVTFLTPAGPFEVTTTVHISVASASLSWKTGKITLVVHGLVTIDSDVTETDHYDVVISQDLILTLNPASQAVTLQASGDPSISGLPAKFKQEALKHVANLKDSVLGPANSQIQPQLNDMRNRFEDGLQTFDGNASSKFTAVEITPDGLILRGTVALSQRPSVVVEVTETADGKALSAFKSWVPGGTINRFVWTWVSPPEEDAVHVPIWGGVEHEVADPHRFIFPPTSGNGKGKGKPGPTQPPQSPPPPWEMYQMCLRLEGQQLGSTNAASVTVLGGTTCQVEQPDWLVATRPPWVDAVLLVPVWGPDPGPEGILERAIVAHVNAAAARPPKDARTNTLIHFAGDQSPAPLRLLSDAMLARHRDDAPLALVLVLPSGAFAQSRRLLEEKLGQLSWDVSVPLAITEDYERSWTRAFGAATVPVTYLMSAGGDLVWHHTGPLQAAALTVALDGSAVAGRPPRPRLQRLAVQPGQSAPGFPFGSDYVKEDRLTTKARRGQPLLVNFWKLASAPSLAELRHLQEVAGSDPAGRLVVAIGDGEGPDEIAKIELGARGRLTLVPDPDRRIARQYGVNCWPTTIAIDWQGIIEGSRFGVSARRRITRA